MDDKHFGESGLRLLWLRITQRYDKKLDSVKSLDRSIRIADGHRIAVSVSGRSGNALKLTGNGLYVSEKAKAVEHKLTIGPHEYDGSADVAVGLYNGEYTEN